MDFDTIFREITTPIAQEQAIKHYQRKSALVAGVAAAFCGLAGLATGDVVLVGVGLCFAGLYLWLSRQ